MTPPDPGADPATTADAEAHSSPLSQISTAELIERLRTDQVWLLRQLDAGRWPEWRLDLAALERELDALLIQLVERQV